jgi:cytochrome P450
MPLLGTNGNFIRFMRDPVRFMDRLRRGYGKIVSLGRGTTDYVFVFGPEYNREVLNNTSLFHNLDARYLPFKIPPHSSLARLYNGLIQMNGARHKQQRQLMMPAFQKKHIENYYNDFIAVIERQLEGWRAGQQRDFFQEMKELTLSIAVKTLVGLDPDRGGAEMRKLLERWMSLIFSPLTMMLPLDVRGLAFHRLLSVSNELEAVIRTLIARKRAAPEGRDVLTALMRARDEDGNRLSDDDLIGQTNFLFMAGHVTTASALTWTLFLLAQHPTALSNVLDECDGKLHGAAPRMDQMDELPLLEAAIKESMRLLPPVIWWSRISAEPFHLGQYELPRGTQVIHSAFITHHLADCYSQPDRFLPERWLRNTPGPYEYIPFSAGPRMCLGSTFAMIEMKLALSILLQRYQFTLPARARVDFSGMMLSAPKRGLPVRLDRRGGRAVRSEVRGSIRRVVDLS